MWAGYQAPKKQGGRGGTDILQLPEEHCKQLFQGYVNFDGLLNDCSEAEDYLY